MSEGGRGEAGREEGVREGGGEGERRLRAREGRGARGAEETREPDGDGEGGRAQVEGGVQGKGEKTVGEAARAKGGGRGGTGGGDEEGEGGGGEEGKQGEGRRGGQGECVSQPMMQATVVEPYSQPAMKVIEDLTEVLNVHTVPN